MVEIYIKLAEMETKREVIKLLFDHTISYSLVITYCLEMCYCLDMFHLPSFFFKYVIMS